ncbi:DNA binding protein [Phytophthora megakarya]|uniref:DNA binding protein n=1 Tax=Phytophthora megakarya TaxID=4795 RepID=A0A225W291_9STRA|nr:DNA binding protein [Phytophthora megakarya]
MTACKTPIRIRLNLEQKIALCKYAKKTRAKGTLNNSLSCDAARRIVEKESEWCSSLPCQLHRKKIVSHRIRKTDVRIMKEFKGMDGVVEAITGKMVKAVAIRVNEVTNMKHSKGWLYKLQQRHGIGRKRKYGELASVDQEAATEGRKKMQKLTDTYD